KDAAQEQRAGDAGQHERCAVLTCGHLRGGIDTRERIDPPFEGCADAINRRRPSGEHTSMYPPRGRTSAVTIAMKPIDCASSTGVAYLVRAAGFARVRPTVSRAAQS